MNIGFEAKRAFNNDTGLGQYSRTLIQSLATYYPQHHYYLCTPKDGALFSTSGSQQMHTVLPQTWMAKKFSAIWRSRWVVADLQRLKMDIFHGLSHELPMGISNSAIPSVVTIHDLIHERFPEQYAWFDRKIYTRKFRNACVNANRIIAISQQTKADIVSIYKIDPNKIDVCYQSCDIAYTQMVPEATKAAIRKQYQLPDSYLLYVGSIIERKNLLNVCKALAKLHPSIQLPLIVIGRGGAYKKEVETFLHQHGLQQQVIFLSYQCKGGVEAVHFPGIYQMASMLIYPSFFEGFGIPVLEALWSKIPVITSNVSCLPEAGGEGAFYVNPSLPQEIADAISTILTNNELVEKQVAIGYDHAQKFTNEKTASKVWEVYQAVLNAKV